ncbi:probable norsolorinic acid reductase [Cephalotrichum gorgonifer]|uniref:Probable norsolorinic acid reductase n=1 Tax=Cephalotrichum gorgonifer TaxID=2041049 RepID=A0AAE8MT46_9PEZI|nr:probable norsolorinic acid reductase [Cephalotrichum gorgonifer]
MGSKLLPAAAPPKSPLARYRMLSPTAAVRVSPLCLGAMNFGNAWNEYLGTCDQRTTEAILDYYYEQAGNFIDTSNNYQFEESEKWIGEWMRKRGVRDQMVIATKYTTNYRTIHGDKEIMINNTGNGTKSLVTSVNASLKKLQTDYIDLLYVHWWDYTVSIPELMQSLNHLVQGGKVLYLGISDTPAWVVSKANEYARNHGLRQFSVYQGRWSAASRDFERDIIPMARDEKMALAPWGALGGGTFKTEKQRTSQEGRRATTSEAAISVSRILEEIAQEKSTIITSVALAYVMHKSPYVFPIIGGRSISHLRDNIEALTLTLSKDDIRRIEGAVPFEIGFPHNFLWGQDGVPENPAEVWLSAMGGKTDHVPLPQPIQPPVMGQKE